MHYVLHNEPNIPANKLNSTICRLRWLFALYALSWRKSVVRHATYSFFEVRFESNDVLS